MAFPDINDYITEVTTEPEFATIKTKFDGGYAQTRERHSRNRHKITAKYFLSATDKDALLAHYQDVRGSVSFSWSHPDDSKIYTVRYATAPKIPSSGKTYGWYKITIQLEEV